MFLATPILLASLSMLESLQLLALSMLIVFLLLNKVSHLLVACSLLPSLGFLMRIFAEILSEFLSIIF
jgi:hypothetical protein